MKRKPLSTAQRNMLVFAFLKVSVIKSLEQILSFVLELEVAPLSVVVFILYGLNHVNTLEIKPGGNRFLSKMSA